MGKELLMSSDSLEGSTTRTGRTSSGVPSSFFTSLIS